ncbi:MAG: PAS domain S-box protein [Chloroflexi bacterium]|nr:PAS domain S-box protein [Chloroflexota bacterium]
MDPFLLLLQAAFYLTFAVTLWRWITRRGPLELAVTAVFAPIAALFLLSLLNGFAPSLSPVFRPILVTLLFLQPWFVVHLVDQIRPVSNRVSWLVLAGCIASTGAILIGTGVALATLTAVVFFFAIQAAAAARLATDSRRRIGVARVRLATAALATALFGFAILLAGVASAATGGASGSTIQIVTRSLALAAGIGYLVAFVPPAWLRRQAYRLMAFDLMRHLVAPDADSSTGRLWADLASSAREILGARRVTILSAPDGLPLAMVGDPEEASQPVGALEPPPATLGARMREALRSKGGVLSHVEVALRPGGGREHLVAEIEGRALFAEDDVALLSLLGALTARTVDREEALITLGQARHALEESAATKASEARFRALLEADPNAILALDRQNTVVWATRQAGELFGGEAARLSGMALADLVALPHDLRPAVGTDRPVFRADTTGRRLDGTHFPAEIARTTFELDGQPFELAVVSDVSWRHEAAQIRDRFLGVLSHELRTPVTSIYGGTQLLLGRGARLDEETRTELLVSVAAESERLQRMIENLVALARIERGAEFAPARPVLLDRVIRDLIDRERQLWPELTIKLEIPHPVQMVSAEEEYLGQVVRNLLSNAAKYSGPGSTIDVEILDGDSGVDVFIRDNGPGISDEESDKLFTLYYRATTQAATAPGAGIGLFICKELVTLMGGRIWARPRPGGGAEFGFSLPAYVEEPDPSFEPLEAPMASGNGNGTTPPVNALEGTEPVAAARQLTETQRAGT